MTGVTIGVVNAEEENDMSSNDSQVRALGPFPPLLVDGSRASSRMNDRGELLVNQAMPSKAELVRQGNSYLVSIATGSAFTYVNAWPTTRAELVLFNGESLSGGKSLIIDTISMVDVTSAAAAQSKAILVQLAVPGTAAPTNDTAQLITSLSGKLSYQGNASRAVANTAFALTNKWEVIGGTNNVQAASIGANVVCDVFGKYIVRPGACFCVAGLASTAAGTAIISVSWHEAQLTLG